jgi:hypothetical protein
MKLLRTGLFPTLLVVLVLVVASVQVLAGVPPGEHVWESPSAWEGGGSLAVGNHGVPRFYDPLLLSLGRLVYADLQRARQAALNKESTNLQVALQEARDTIHRLELPSQVMALDAQLQIIRNDLKDRSKGMDDELWVPVEAEIDEVLVYVPDEVKPQVKEAVRRGKAAARAGDRVTASAQLDVITSSMQYSLGMFPLSKVKEDLNAAWATASLPKPDWTGTLEAIQSALAAFHWYTRQSAHGLLAAYNDVVSAYVLAAGPRFRPDQKQQVLDYLSAAERELESVPGSHSLAEKDGRLIDKIEPQGSDIKVLLNDIQLRIQDERQRAAERYRDQIGRGAAG